MILVQTPFRSKSKFYKIAAFKYHIITKLKVSLTKKKFKTNCVSLLFNELEVSDPVTLSHPDTFHLSWLIKIKGLK